ncbi:MAG TPA: AarF/UbiB family protein, partial [Pyrinomonadaceae bacterium]|nr:AarF/UbiB family protein [Pyrinomonadaceae bacterium]
MTETEQQGKLALRASNSGADGNGNGANGQRRASLTMKLTPARMAATEGDAEQLVLLPGAQVESAQEDGNVSAHSLRGWLRTLNITRVLGTLSFYLFLDGYDIRANFNRRIAGRNLEDARARGRVAYFQAWTREIDRRAVDKLIRLIRFFIFRGAEGEDKEARHEKQAVWLKENLIKLGPTFIKIGQALGTRGDLLPLAYVKELALLQDQVPPFPTAEAYARIESELGRTVQELYAEIDAEPIAAASLGQVYRARLHTGQEVAVKVQRPNLREAINFDLAILRNIVRQVNRYFPQANENADWEGMLKEFAVTVFEEMDYVQEGRNANRFRANFKEWRA